MPETPLRDRAHPKKEVPLGEHRPPPDPHPPYDAVGLDALSPLLGRVEFPADKRAIAAALGPDLRIPVGREESLPLRELLDRLAPETFQSGRHLEDTIRHAWRDLAAHERRGGHHRQAQDTSRAPARTPEARGPPHAHEDDAVRYRNERAR